LRIGIEQKDLATCDTISGSGAAERLYRQRRDSAALLARLIAARDRWAKVSGSPPSIVLC
jgi:transposase